MNILLSSEFNKPMQQLVGQSPGLQAWDMVGSLSPGTTSTPLENYTGLVAPNDSTYRAAVDWSTGIQQKDGKIGMFLNGFSTAAKVYPGVPNKFMPYWSMNASKTQMNEYPWTGSTHLHLAAKIGLGHVYTQGESGCQIYCGLGFYINGQYRELIVLIWDSRNIAFTEYVRNDVHGVSFAGTNLAAGTKFCTNFGATTLQGTQSWRSAQMYFDITQQNMQEILKAFNMQSVPLSSVKLVSCSFQCELFGPDTLQFKESQFGATFENLIAAVW